MTPAKSAGLPFQGSLTPLWIVVYMAIHAIWRQVVLGPYIFAELRLLFLIVLAVMLALNGHAREIGFYFIGRCIPDLSTRRIVLIFSVVAVTRLAVEAANPFQANPLTMVWGDCVIAPVNEEIVFRGVFLAILLQYLPRRPLAAIAISALVFASVHDLVKHGSAVDGIFLITLLASGGLYGWIYWQSRSVPLCIACHAFWNLFAFVPLVEHR